MIHLNDTAITRAMNQNQALKNTCSDEFLPVCMCDKWNRSRCLRIQDQRHLGEEHR